MSQRPDPTEADFICQPYDFEKIVPLQMIREHTNTDDVPHVSDALLSVYRRASLEAAQQYTGLLLTGRETITEDVNVPNPFGSRREMMHWARGGYDYSGPTSAKPFQFTAKYAFAQNFAIFWGTQGSQRHRIEVTPGTRLAMLPATNVDILSRCCDPWHQPGPEINKIMYVAGFADECAIPAGIALGCLKYIAHVIENAGDVPMVTTAQGNSGPSNTLLNQASNPALASGAIDIWRNVAPQVV